jgi:hypothetical protein
MQDSCSQWHCKRNFATSTKTKCSSAEESNKVKRCKSIQTREREILCFPMSLIRNPHKILRIAWKERINWQNSFIIRYDTKWSWSRNMFGFSRSNEDYLLSVYLYTANWTRSLTIPAVSSQFVWTAQQVA